MAVLLSAGPVFGPLSANSTSPTFTSSLNVQVNVVVLMTSVAASGNVKLQRSSDGGNTWTDVTPNTDFVSSNDSKAIVAKTYFFTDRSTPLQYRLAAALGSESAFFTACCDNDPQSVACKMMSSGIVLTDTGATVPAGFQAMTVAQLVSLYQARLTTPTTASLVQTTGLSLYKRGLAGTLITLAVPDDAWRFPHIANGWGVNRLIRVTRASVTSIVDAQGNAVSSDTSVVDPSTIYTVGATIIATEYLNTPSRQPIRNFFSPGDTYGLYGFMSKIEAAVYAPFSGCPIMNLSKLGL